MGIKWDKIITGINHNPAFKKLSWKTAFLQTLRASKVRLKYANVKKAMRIIRRKFWPCLLGLRPHAWKKKLESVPSQVLSNTVKSSNPVSCDVKILGPIGWYIRLLSKLKLKASRSATTTASEGKQARIPPRAKGNPRLRKRSVQGMSLIPSPTWVIARIKRAAPVGPRDNRALIDQPIANPAKKKKLRQVRK